MVGLVSSPTDLEVRQEQAARAFIASKGFEHIDDIAFIPDQSEPIDAKSVHVTLPTVQFTHFNAVNHRRERTEISAIGMIVPIR